MITSEELRASGERLSATHRQDALLLAATHMTCEHLLRASGSDRDENGRRMLAILHECVAARGRELGIGANGLAQAAKDIRRASDVLDYLDTLPA